MVDVEAEWQSRTVGRIRPRWVRALARQGKAGQEAPETPTASLSSPAPRLKAIGAQLSKSGLSQLPAADIASSRNRQEEEEEEEEEKAADGDNGVSFWSFAPTATISTPKIRMADVCSDGVYTLHWNTDKYFLTRWIIWDEIFVWGLSRFWEPNVVWCMGCFHEIHVLRQTD